MSVARRFAQIKAGAVRRAVPLSRGRVRVTIDSGRQTGMLGVHVPGHGRVHLPAGTPLR